MEEKLKERNELHRSGSSNANSNTSSEASFPTDVNFHLQHFLSFYLRKTRSEDKNSIRSGVSIDFCEAYTLSLDMIWVERYACPKIAELKKKIIEKQQNQINKHRQLEEQLKERNGLYHHDA